MFQTTMTNSIYKAYIGPINARKFIYESREEKLGWPSLFFPKRAYFLLKILISLRCLAKLLKENKCFRGVEKSTFS